MLRYFLLPLLFLLIISCSKKELSYNPSEPENPYELYKEGMDAFDRREFFFAEKKFSEAELNFREVELSAKSALMSIFSLYAINFYDEALQNLEVFLKKYPGDKNIIYAEYLKTVIYFELIGDEKKDTKPLILARENIDKFLKKYPNTDYAIDLRFKRKLIINQLAAKELYVAKHYISIQKWAAAIKRLKIIVNDYDETIFIEEALHRLVEICYYIGLEEEAKNYASILGYNYNSSEWFQQSYKVLNKKYELPKKDEIRDKDKNFLKRIIEKII